MYKDILRKYGVTQIDLAERLGMNRVSVSRLLSDSNDMRLSTLRKIAAAVGCSVGELVGDEAGQDTAPGQAMIICPHCGKPITLHADPAQG